MGAPERAFFAPQSFVDGGGSGLSSSLASAPVAVLDPSRRTASPPGAGQVPSSVGRSFAKASRSYVIRLAALDALMGALATAVPASISNTLSYDPIRVVVLSFLGALLWPLAIGLVRGYTSRQVGVGFDELRAVFRAGIAVVVVGAFPAGLLNEHTILKLVVIAVPLAVVLSLATRFITRKLLHRQQVRGLNVRHVVVVGSAQATHHLCERLERERHCGMKVIGVCVPEEDLQIAGIRDQPVLGTLADVANVVRRLRADGVAVTNDDITRHDYLRQLSWSLEGAGIEMLVDPGLVEVAGPRMHIRPLMGFPLLHVEEPHFVGWRRVIKRATDVVLSAAGVVMAAPVLLAIAIAVKLQDGGPVLFRQVRVGRGGKPFTMLKFRSMVIDAEQRKLDLLTRNEGKGGLFKLTSDPRVTRLGRFLRDFSLDELPQLFNVLNGSMSLVGPRPHLAHELAQMPTEASRRSLVTPGLTGLWQISGRSDLEGDDAIRLDLRYVENWSLTLDLLILWKTGSAVLARRGAH